MDDNPLFMKACLFFFLVIICTSLYNNGTDPLVPEEKIKGVCWVGYDSIDHTNIDELNANHIEWISQTPFIYQNGVNNPNLRFDNTRVPWGERDEGLIEITNLAREKGIKTMLKPHIWISNSNGKWRSDIDMNSENDWAVWFELYSTALIHYAKVAEAGKMAAFCIGTELRIPATKFPQKWRSLICDIRDIYSGQLTYAANFYKEYEEIEFWDDLDYIGIQAYFPLSKSTSPDLKKLINSWDKHKRSLKAVSEKFNKKIVFTEIGYKNSEDAAIEPWVWPRQMDETVMACEITQANCYEAMFASNWSEDWFGGLFIWKWFSGSYESTYEEILEYRKQRRKERGIKISNKENIGFTPQSKEAQKIMKKWFGKIH